MTRSPAGRRPSPPDYAELAESLAASGLRLTPQRALVLEELRRMPTTATAQELFERLHPAHPYLGRATVFRTLDSLVDAGLAQRFERSGHVHAYAACSERHHHHLVCTRCEQAIEVDESLVEPLVDALRERHGFHAEHGALDFYGVCAGCAGEVR